VVAATRDEVSAAISSLFYTCTAVPGVERSGAAFRHRIRSGLEWGGAERAESGRSSAPGVPGARPSS
jgi:hypothetical protein